MPICPHCLTREAMPYRRRGLCHFCYYKTPEVRDFYPSWRDVLKEHRIGLQCKHCQKTIELRKRDNKKNVRRRDRGLCRPCFDKPHVRSLYPTLHGLIGYPTGLGVGGDHNNNKQPPEPTVAFPGTEEKIQVMCWRAENGYNLFHPADAMYEEDAHGLIAAA